MGMLKVDSETGAVEEIYRWSDACWVEIIPGAPKIIGEQIITVEDRNDARSLVINNHPISGDDLQVRSLINCNEQGVIAAVSSSPLEQHIMHFDFEGKRTAFTEDAGVHDAVSNGETTVIQYEIWMLMSQNNSLCRGFLISEIKDLSNQSSLST